MRNTQNASVASPVFEGIGGSDGSDAQFELPPSTAGEDMIDGGLTSPLDPVVAEHGDFFVAHEETVEINQIAVAAKFAEERQIVFDADNQEFRKYNPTTGHFAVVKEPQIKWELAGFIKNIAEKDAAGAFVPKRTNSLLGAIVNLVKGCAPAPERDLDHKVVHVGNGMLDLTTDIPNLRPFSPDYFSTRFCPIRFDPDAKCERFLRELLQPAVAAEDISLLQRISGAALLGPNRAQRCEILYGSAAAGKSTFVNILEKILGPENVAHLRTEHMGSRFETHGYHNKTLLSAKDVAGDFLSSKGAKMLKALVGDDQLETELKFGGKHRLRGDLQVTITSNSRLKLAVEDDEEAWRRRLLIVEFKRDEAPKRIPNFADVLLKEEGEGILAWMIKGAVDHLAELKKLGDFALTESQRKRIDDVLLESKSPEEFVRTGLVKKANANVTVEELTERYFRFCEARQWQPFTMRQFENAVAELMLKHHATRRRNDIRREGKAVRGFKGVGLSPTSNAI